MSHSKQARRHTVSDALNRAGRRWKDRTALLYQDRSWNFEELAQAASNIAAHFGEMGLSAGDRVACYGRNSDAYLLAWLGCAEAGVAHVPVNYALRGEELSYIIKQSGARAVLFDPDLHENLQKIQGDLARVAQIPLRGEDGGSLLWAAKTGSKQFMPPALDGQDLAQIMYTSGTTSRPKGAMMSHEAILAEYASCIHELDYAPEDRALAALPLYHTAQMQAFTMPQLLCGIYTHLIDSPDPATVLRIIEEDKITSFFAPPTVWISLLRHPDLPNRDLSSLRKLYYGAAIMPEPVLQELRQTLPKAGLYNVYGQTEIAPVATVLRPEEHEERPTSAGKPVLFVETRVVNEEMEDVAPGEMGEIVHRSPQLLSGYWEKPEATEEAFKGGWFHSGDLGRFDDQGYLYVVDRIKDVVNTGGVLVASREVEEAIFSHPSVSEVAVVALPDAKWIEVITAVVVLRDGASSTEEDIVTHARTSLAAYKIPKRVVFQQQLPKNASGKILKRELREALSE